MKIDKVTFENQGSDSKVYAEFSGDTAELQAYFVSLLGGGAPAAHSETDTKEEAKPRRGRPPRAAQAAETHEAPAAAPQPAPAPAPAAPPTPAPVEAHFTAPAPAPVVLVPAPAAPVPAPASSPLLNEDIIGAATVGNYVKALMALGINDLSGVTQHFEKCKAQLDARMVAKFTPQVAQYALSLYQ